MFLAVNLSVNTISSYSSNQGGSPSAPESIVLITTWLTSHPHVTMVWIIYCLCLLVAFRMCSRINGSKSKVRLFESGLYRLLQNRLWFYGHVLRKEDNHWVKKCMEYEVKGPRPRGRLKRSCDLERDCGKGLPSTQIEQGGCYGSSRWKKMIKDDWWSGWVWMGECFFWYQLTWVVPTKGR